MADRRRAPRRGDQREGTAAKRTVRRGRLLTRVPPGVLLALRILAAGLLVVGGFLVMFPFDAASSNGRSETTARCGPPVFELLVPPDPAFAGPESEDCTGPAGPRVLIGSLAIGAFFAIAIANQWGDRRHRPRRARSARRSKRSGARGSGAKRSGAKRAGSGPVAAPDVPELVGEDEGSEGPDPAVVDTAAAPPEPAAR